METYILGESKGEHSTLLSSLTKQDVIDGLSQMIEKEGCRFVVFKKDNHTVLLDGQYWYRQIL